MEIKQALLDPEQYFHEDVIKTQIVWHHTASGGDVFNLAKYFNSNKERVATHYGIGRDGTIIQMIPHNCWGSHVNCDGYGNTGNGGKQKLSIEKRTIGIELVNWGYLIEDPKTKTFHNYTSYKVKDGKYQFLPDKHSEVTEDVVKLPTPFRGFYYFQDYTDAQMDSLYYLTAFLCGELEIDHTKVFDSFDVSDKAVNQEWSIVSHTNFRKDKTDVFPSPKIIAMLDNLKYSMI